MNNEEKNTITVGELISKIHPGHSNIYKFSDSMQKQFNSTAKIMNRAMESVMPTLKQLNQIQQPLIPEMPKLEYVRPVEYKILDELRDMNSEGKNEPRDISFLIFDEEEKILRRDSLNRSYQYKFKENGMKFRLFLKLLEEDTDFIQTIDLKVATGSVSLSATRKIVQELNKDISIKLKQKDLNIIEGESGSGYRINRKIKLKIM